MILTQEYSRVAVYSRDNRAWMISPEGKVYNCGHNHVSCDQNQKFLDETEGWEYIGNAFWMFLFRKGWAKVGMFGGNLVTLDTKEFNDNMFRAFQGICSGIGLKGSEQVSITWKDSANVFEWGIFKNFDSIADMNKYARTMF